MSFNLEKFKASALHDSTADEFKSKDAGDYGATIMEASIGGSGDGEYGAWARYDITLNFDDGDRRRIGMFLDVGISADGEPFVKDSSKNIPFGQLRTAIGKNAAGSTFNWGDPEGHHVIVTLSHKLDKNGKTREEIKGFRKG
jgi:hypothetical protein